MQNAEEKMESTKKRPVDTSMDVSDDDMSDDDTEENVTLSRRPMEEIDMEDDEDEEEMTTKSGDEKEQEIQNLEFEFSDPMDDDFHYVKSLLNQGACAGIPSLIGNFSDIADRVVKQKAVGTMIKVPESSEQLYSMATILGLKEHKQSPAIKSLLKYLISQCPAGDRQRVELLLAGKQGSIGWLLNERILNVPSQVAAPLHNCLLEDMQWVRENLEEAGAFNGQFDFDHVLVICPVINPENSGNGSKKAKQEVDQDYYKFEEEFFTKVGHTKFECRLSFPVPEGRGAVPQSNKPKKAIATIMKYSDLVNVVQNELANVELEF